MLDMPTPFMHLHAAHRFLNDTNISETLRAQLGSKAKLGAFLLGNVAPDARVSGGLSRTKTHFFDYRPRVKPDAGDAMLEAHPDLKHVKGAHQAFVCGYLAHLTMDVVWCETLLFPYFYFGEWGDDSIRYFILHVLLCHLDAMDYRQWAGNFPDALRLANPEKWLTFLPDKDLAEWRDIVARQICESCKSETLGILGQRVRMPESELRTMLESEERMQSELWQHVSRDAITETQTKMYESMVAWITRYMSEAA